MPLIVFAVACIEVIGLIRVGGVIGGMTVWGLILITAVLGLTILRLRGGAAVTAIVVSLFAGRLTPKQLLHRRDLSILAGGVLLIVPGLITDVLGCALLIRALFTRRNTQRSVKEERDAIDVVFKVHDDAPRE